MERACKDAQAGELARAWAVRVDSSCIGASITWREAADAAAPSLFFVGSIEKWRYKADTLHYMIADPVRTFEKLTA